MRHIVCKLSLVMLCLCFVSMHAYAVPYRGKITKRTTVKADLERCRRAQGSAELSVNNVRARINQGGNMWYDGTTAQYFIPKDGTSTAMFCAALWIGGQDENEQLRVAALKFGQSGDDYWPGPLTVDGAASVNKSVCDQWDKLYRITKAEVQAFVAYYDEYGTVNSELITDAIRNWPGNGNTSLGQSRFLAPFFDRDKDGKYDPNAGDYPYYDFNGDLCPATIKANLPKGSTYTPIPTMESDTTNDAIYGTGGRVKAVGGILTDQVLKGDETLWWIFNDKGNSHTESGSENPIGLEIRAQAFGFTMNNEINDMTFYSYEIINRSTFTLTNTYFSQWVDPDLGYAHDDYVGCDVERGLGYCYNGKATDGPGTGMYDGNPPAIGIDFFQGPYMDPDGKDNPKVQEDVLRDKYGQAVLDQYKDSTGKVNPILLTEDADKYKDCWYPAVGAAKDSNGACAINGVNFGNGIVDDERFGMRRFVYYNNNSDPNGEPESATDYYNYLRGIWKDNKRMNYGGNGYNGGNGFQSGIVADFMFPGTSDIWGWGTSTDNNEAVGKNNEWSEVTAGNSPYDRRFMQSAGPFTLKPGAINYITVGIPFARATTGGPNASVELLRSVDDRCQALFDNCFNILEGPDAPDVAVQELDREIILYLTNSEAGNNANESFSKVDPSIPRYYTVDSTLSVDTIVGSDGNYYTHRNDTNVSHDYDRKYTFEGYQIFQLKDGNVSVSDLYDNDKARLVAQCDISNFDKTGQPIAKLTNYNTDGDGNLAPQVMVSGANNGIQHTFRITEDKFATTTDTRIVNNKKYYYIAIAYAYNNYKTFNPTDATAVDGQKTPYLSSRKMADGSAIVPTVAIPHKVNSLMGGSTVQSAYGISPEIIRYEGNGNGGMVLSMNSTSIESLMGAKGVEPTLDASGNVTNLIETPVYKENNGPLNIRIVDPLKVKSGNFYIKLIPKAGFANIMDSCSWILTRTNPTEPLFTIGDSTYYSVTSERSIGSINEQIIRELGISISINNVANVATPSNAVTARDKYQLISGQVIKGAYLSSSIVYDDPTKAWLSGFADNDGSTYTNWIRSGSSLPKEGESAATDQLADYHFLDASGKAYAVDSAAEFEAVVYGMWSPYRLASYLSYHPAFTRAYLQSAGESFSTDWTNSTKIPSLMSNDLNNLASVDIVFTSDKSKWTRCPVIEMGTDVSLTEGGAKKFMLRRHASVDKNGNDEATGQGMGWFPGYAVNLETGERLNIMFGENSELGEYNGRDMIWNPVQVTGNASNPAFGGMHYVYILGTSQFKMFDMQDYDIVTVNPPRYDEGQWAYNHLVHISQASGATDEANISFGEQLFASVMWVGMPTTSIFSYGSVRVPMADKSPTRIPTNATVQIRVRKPYSLYWSADMSQSNSPATPQNANYPMYQFSIGGDLAAIINNNAIAESALDNITVVPNPYFAGNPYENDQIHNLVKITNLPPECYITIYAVDGTVVRKLRGPSSALVAGNGGTALTSVDWDLKNERGLQISGGVYLIHIKADGVGEKLVKWFGALRPVDLNSFQ